MNVTVSLSPASLRSGRATRPPADARVVRDALARPLRFRYSGPLDLFRTWGLCGPSTDRDADILSESNFEVITADMTARFPRDCAVVYSSHPSVGWCNQLAVRVLTDDGAVTEAFRAMLDWRRRLEVEPVADEIDYGLRKAERDSNARWAWSSGAYREANIVA